MIDRADILRRIHSLSGRLIMASEASAMTLGPKICTGKAESRPPDMRALETEQYVRRLDRWADDVLNRIGQRVDDGRLARLHAAVIAAKPDEFPSLDRALANLEKAFALTWDGGVHVSIHVRPSWVEAGEQWAAEVVRDAELLIRYQGIRSSDAAARADVTVAHLESLRRYHGFTSKLGRGADGDSRCQDRGAACATCLRISEFRQALAAA